MNEKLKVDGTGIIVAQERGQILQTWYHDKKYRLTNQHTIEPIEQDLYAMNTKVKIKNKLALQKSRIDSTVSIVLEPGELATILSSDGREWCLIRNSKGEEGWFAIDRYDTIRGTGQRACEFFDELSCAN